MHIHRPMAYGLSAINQHQGTYTMGKGWSLITMSNSTGLRYNAMIKAEVDVYK